MPKGIFISYRRADISDSAKEIYSTLRQRFPRKGIYFDFDQKHRGEDVKSTLKDYLDNSQFVLVLIGPNWDLERLKDNDDYVLFELQRALTIEHQQQTAWRAYLADRRLPTQRELATRLGIPAAETVEFHQGDIPVKIVPVLIGRADFPDLPPGLKALADKERIVRDTLLDTIGEITELVRGLRAPAQWNHPGTSSEARSPAIWIGGSSDVLRWNQDVPALRSRTPSQCFEDLLQELTELDREAVRASRTCPPRATISM